MIWVIWLSHYRGIDGKPVFSKSPFITLKEALGFALFLKAQDKKLVHLTEK